MTDAERAHQRDDDEVAVRGWTAEVVVLPKEGVSDPEGEAILGGLKGLGYDGVRSVQAGRLFRVELAARSGDEARAETEEMCERLLANPVIERYAVRLDGPSAADEGPLAETPR